MRYIGIVLLWSLTIFISSGCSKRESPELLIFVDHSGSVSKIENYYNFSGKKVGEILGYFPKGTRVKVYHYAANVNVAFTGNIEKFQNRYLLPSVLNKDERNYTLHSQLLQVIGVEKSRNRIFGAIVITDGKSAPPKPLKDIEFVSISDSIGLPVLWIKPDSAIVLLTGNIQIANPSIQEIRRTFGLTKPSRVNTFVIVLFILILLVIGVGVVIIRRKKPVSMKLTQPKPKFSVVLSGQAGEAIPISIYKDKAILVNRNITKKEQSDDKIHYIQVKQYFPSTFQVEIEKVVRGKKKFYKITNNSPGIVLQIDCDGTHYEVKKYESQSVQLYQETVMEIYTILDVGGKLTRIDICRVQERSQ